MATVTLSRLYPELATYYNASTSWDQSSLIWNPQVISVPVWKSGAKTFNGYWSGSQNIVGSGGWVNLYENLPSSITVTERWTGLPIAVIKNGDAIIGEFAYDSGVWYQDNATKTAISTTVRLTKLPSKTNYRFLGIFSNNASSGGTMYVDADGYGTNALARLAPTADLTFYVRFELVTKTITINAEYGDWEFKKFYQRIADGVYTKNSNGRNEITGITPPRRECYKWNGLFKTSSSSSTKYAYSTGAFSQDFLNRSPADATVYGDFWSRVAYKITIDPNGGTLDSDKAVYYRPAEQIVVRDWLDDSTSITVKMPYRKGYICQGLYDQSSGGTQLINRQGVQTSAIHSISSNATVYAHWAKATGKIQLDPQGGTLESRFKTLYYYKTTSMTHMAITDSTGKLLLIQGITPPQYVGNAFSGFFDAAEGGQKYIDEYGNIMYDLDEGDHYWYAHWIIGKSNITVDPGDGTGGTKSIYCDIATQTFYADRDMTRPITSIHKPTLQLYDFTGLYDQAGLKYVDEDGHFVDPLPAVIQDENMTLYARYVRRCYKVSLDPDGGQSDVQAIYYTSDGFYADEFLTQQITTVQTYREGHTYTGYYYNDIKVLAADGHIMQAANLGQDYTATAAWTVNTYTLYFNASGGTVPYSSKNVVYGQSIGQLPTPTFDKQKFLGWTIDDRDISSTTKYTWGQDKTAVAMWETNVGYVWDYWGLKSSTLIPIKSSDGMTSQVIHTASGSQATYKLVPNPTVTYMVIGNTDLRCTLGQMGTDNYMITQVTVNTSLATPPTVTVQGVANEGTRAVNSYDVEVHISPRHRAQDIANAIVTDGELHQCTYTAKCDPVVVYGTDSTGQMVPIASDVVHGIATVQAQIMAYDMQYAPTSRNGWTLTSVEQTNDHIGYKSFNTTLEKEI